MFGFKLVKKSKLDELMEAFVRCDNEVESHREYINGELDKFANYIADMNSVMERVTEYLGLEVELDRLHDEYIVHERVPAANKFRIHERLLAIEEALKSAKKVGKKKVVK